MNDYFDQVEHGMRDAVRRRAHLPWYARLLGVRHGRGLVALAGTLVIAAPAVGAVTNWFGFGAPDRFPSQSATVAAGRALPATSEVLSLRVADPRGGPPWGLRLVRTTRRDTCIQLGRVEKGTLGSLGIDGAWNNDRLFHPFPSTSIGEYCGTTDAAGDGFENIATGEIADANPTAGATGPQARGCQFGGCPAAAMRLVFLGLLGPDATSVTYQAPDGSLKVERTSGNDGGYLLVFPLDQRTCGLYTNGPSGGYSPCASVSFMGASPDQLGAIKAVTYRDGHVCHLVPSAALMARYRAVGAIWRTYLKGHPRLLPRISHGPLSARERAVVRALLERLVASEHLTLAEYLSIGHPTCPPIGYVEPQIKRLTAAQVAAPVTVKILRPEFGEFHIDVVFSARQPVTSSRSWYEDYFTNPRGCSSGGQGGEVGFGNIRAGAVIHDNRLLGSCRGVYHGLIGYMQYSGPLDQNTVGGGMPGTDGTIVVARFTFRLP